MSLGVEGADHALLSQCRDKVDLILIVNCGSSIRELAVAADGVVDTVIVIGKKLHFSVLYCIQFVILIEPVFLHVGTEEDHFSFEDARVVDAHVLLLHKCLKFSGGDRILL